MTSHPHPRKAMATAERPTRPGGLSNSPNNSISTSDQQSKVQGILESERSQIESLRQDSSVSQQDRHSKMMDIHQSTNTQIRALLDSTQQAKWDKMQANRQQWMQNRHQGQPGGDSGHRPHRPISPSNRDSDKQGRSFFYE